MNTIQVEHAKGFTIILDNAIINNKMLSYEGVGFYVMLECGNIGLEDVPPRVIDQLKRVGYLRKV